MRSADLLLAQLLAKYHRLQPLRLGPHPSCTAWHTVNAGILDNSTYLVIAKAWKFMSGTALTEEALRLLPACRRIAEHTLTSSTSTVGQFLLAATQVFKLTASARAFVLLIELDS